MKIRRNLTAGHTLLACYVGYLTQALVINYPPLLFVTFQRELGLSLSQLSTLIALAFITQLSMDALASVYMKYASYRSVAIAAHAFAVLGMISLGILPAVLPSPFLGLCIGTTLASIGGGLVEVVISPMAEACPTENKSGSMSLLHSFYCWGQLGTTLLSTLFFLAFGREHWALLAVLWAILPLMGAVAFCVVPVYRLKADEENPSFVRRTGGRQWGLFALFFLLMICAGAAEQIMSQWASSFAEAALGVNKTLGDILGPCAFALMMALARTFYGVKSERIDLLRFITASCGLCVAAYLLAALSPWPALSLLGCGLCGLSVGILWPGTYSLAARRLSHCGVTTYALLALGGDVGCLVGPSVAGQIAQWFGGELRYAFLFALVFPLAALLVAIGLPRGAAGKDE